MPDLSGASTEILTASIAGVVLFLVAVGLFVFVVINYITKYRHIDLNFDILSPDIAYFHERGKRERQEDSIYISELDEYRKNGFVACVSDGMGGLANGDVVSEFVVDCISNMAPLSFFATEENATSIRRISDAISDEYQQQAGATLAMVNILNNYMTFYSVGDSNIMLIRKGEVTILNQKQNYVSLLVRTMIKSGKQTQDAYVNPKARALTDFMGNTVARVIYSAKPIRLYDGDTIIVCSDGVTDAVSEKNIAQYCSSISAANTASNIKLSVKSRKLVKQDNYTAVVIKLGRPLI